MAAGDEYTTGGGGRLKIKGVQDGRIGKKKKKKTTKSKKTEDENENKEKIEEKGGDVNKDVDAAMKEGGEKGKGDEDMVEKRKKEEGEGGDDHAESLPKTKAEIEYEERRKKRLLHRLKREGVKTHKEQVEELNKYLSTLSEHHDMPKIGPG